MKKIFMDVFFVAAFLLGFGANAVADDVKGAKEKAESRCTYEYRIIRGTEMTLDRYGREGWRVVAVRGDQLPSRAIAVIELKHCPAD